MHSEKSILANTSLISKISSRKILPFPRGRSQLKLARKGNHSNKSTIRENGNATDIKMAQSSGFEVLDDNVIKTVEAVAPFPKPPVRAELRVPRIYRLE